MHGSTGGGWKRDPQGYRASRLPQPRPKAAGTCRMRLGGELLTLGTPELIPAEEGVEGMPRLFRFALRHVIHTADCVRLPILKTSRAPATRR
jgi:hypothetical protein